MASVTWFEDTETAATFKRPGFERLQKAIFNGEVEFVRGKTRSLAEIEDDILSRYGMEKPKSGRPDYLLSIPYETDEELDRISYAMWEEGNPERNW